MNFDKLVGVDPRLVAVIKLASLHHEFIIVEGLRTLERQKEMVRKGASQTMHSKHLTGRAVDLVPVIDSEISWAWPQFYPLAEAVKGAARELDTTLIWGACWDRPLNELQDCHAASNDYVTRRARIGLKSFLDGPHFELTP
jgi:peptidoglycan L-alanyl-D-glutamate endopeptidase CwlK